MRTVLITGATGLIGQHIVDLFLENQISVKFLSTNKTKLVERPNYKGYYWNPSTGDIDEGCFEGVSVIINLAGSAIARRWTEANKKEIFESRIDSIELLLSTIKSNNFKIDHFISASAIGYYPFSDINFYEEDYETNINSFLINVVREWEKAADKFQEIDIPVSKIRIGLVLSDQGGAMQELVKPIKRYLGSCLGSGDQWQSWIHIDDVARMFLFVLNNELYGTFNGVAPNPVTQDVFIHQIARSLHRPLILPNIPEVFMRLILGKMHVLVTKGQRVSSKKMERLGFQYKFYQLEAALQDLLK